MSPVTSWVETVSAWRRGFVSMYIIFSSIIISYSRFPALCGMSNWREYPSADSEARLISFWTVRAMSFSRMFSFM